MDEGLWGLVLGELGLGLEVESHTQPWIAEAPARRPTRMSRSVRVCCTSKPACREAFSGFTVGFQAPKLQARLF